MPNAIWSTAAVVAFTALAACGGGRGSAEPFAESNAAGSSDAVSAGEAPDRVDTRRSDHEATPVVPPVVQPATPVVQPATPVVQPATPATRPLITISQIGAGDAEDGSGHVVSQAQRIAVDLDARVFPPRALDPVLHVGALRFVHYSHPRPGVLRFAVDAAARLALGAELAVQYGDDVASRRVVLQAITQDDLRGLAP